MDTHHLVCSESGCASGGVGRAFRQAYADYSVKQVQYQQYSSGDYYHFLLEKTGSLDMTVNIDPEGNIVLD